MVLSQDIRRSGLPVSIWKACTVPAVVARQAPTTATHSAFKRNPADLASNAISISSACYFCVGCDLGAPALYESQSEVMPAGNYHPIPKKHLDRKSTRLNSSHVRISYA